MSFSSSYLSGYMTNKTLNYKAKGEGSGGYSSKAAETTAKDNGSGSESGKASGGSGSGSGKGSDGSGSGSGKGSDGSGSGSGKGSDGSGSGSGKGSDGSGSGSGKGSDGSGSGSGKGSDGSGSGSGKGSDGSGSGSGKGSDGSGSGSGKGSDGSGSGSGKGSDGSGSGSGKGSDGSGSGSGDDGDHDTGTISGTVFCDTNCDGVNGEIKVVGSGSGSGKGSGGSGSGSGKGSDGSGSGSGKGSDGSGSGSGKGSDGSGSGSGKGSDGSGSGSGKGSDGSGSGSGKGSDGSGSGSGKGSDGSGSGSGKGSDGSGSGSGKGSDGSGSGSGKGSDGSGSGSGGGSGDDTEYVPEPVKAGVLIKLLDLDGNIVAETTTDENGNYRFEGVPIGDYRIMGVAPDGTEFTIQDAGDNDDIDSDVDENGTSGVIHVTGSGEADIDLGVCDKPNTPPTAFDDAGTTCADEFLFIDVLADNGNGADFDPDGDPLTVTAIDGTQVIDGDTVLVDGTATITDRDGNATQVDFTGLEATLNGNGFTFGGSTAFGDLEIGEVAEVTLTYEIADGAGGIATADIDLTFCGALTTVDSIADSLPTGQNVAFTVAPFQGPGSTPLIDSYTVTLESSFFGPDPVVVEQAYCLDRTLPVVRGVEINSDLFVATADLAGGSSLSAQTLDNLDLVNWLINQQLEGTNSVDGVNVTSDDTYSGAEIQAAIWGLIGDTPFLPAGTGTSADVNDLIAAAQANGEGYVPGDGDLFTFLLDPDLADGTGHEQPFLIAVSFDQDCECSL